MIKPLMFFLKCMLIAVLCLCSGCLELEQHIKIAADDGIEVAYCYVIPPRTLALLQGMKPVMDEAQGGKSLVGQKMYQWILQENAVREYFGRNDCRVVDFKRQTASDGSVRVSFAVKADDYRKALMSGVFGDFEVIENRGKVEIKTNPMVLLSSCDEAKLNQLSELCKGMTLSLTIQTPKTMLKTSGTYRNGRAEWLIDAEKDKDFLRKIPEISVIFDAAAN